MEEDSIVAHHIHDITLKMSGQLWIRYHLTIQSQVRPNHCEICTLHVEARDWQGFMMKL